MKSRLASVNQRNHALYVILIKYPVLLLCGLSVIVGAPFHAHSDPGRPSVWIGAFADQRGEQQTSSTIGPSRLDPVASKYAASPRLVAQMDVRSDWLERELYHVLIAAERGHMAEGLLQMGRSLMSRTGQPGEPLAWPWLTTLFPRFEIPQWIKRVDLDFDLQGDEGPVYSIRTRQPLFQSTDHLHTLFTQVRWGKVNQLGIWRDTTNIGLGYRQLLHDRTILLGANAFFDRDWRKDHNRIGVGAEARWFGVDVYINGYWGISADNSIDATTKEKVLDGWDAYALMQVPYIPSMRVVGRVFQWDKSGGDKWDGWRAGIEADLTPYTQVQAGATDSDQDSVAAFVQLRINFGYYGNRPVLLSKQPFSRNAWQMRDMRGYTLDRIRRQENIVVEQTSTSTGGTGAITIVVGRS